MKSSRWGKEEIEILKKYYPTTSNKDLLTLLPNRTRRAIINKAEELGLKKKNIFWSKEEIEILKKHYFSSSWEELTKLLPNRSKNAIRHKAQKLGLNRKRKKIIKETEKYVKVLKTEIPKDIFKKLSELSEQLSIPETRLITEAVAEYLSRKGYSVNFSANKDKEAILPDTWTEEMANLYLATWLDTEGWLGLSLRKHPNNKLGIQYMPVMQIVNKRKEPLVIIQNAFGGHLYERKRKYKGKVKTYWEWSCRVEKIPYILKRIYPYLIIKKNTAKLLLEYFEKYPRKRRVGKRSHSLQRFKFLENIYKQIKKEQLRGRK